MDDGVFLQEAPDSPVRQPRRVVGDRRVKRRGLRERRPRLEGGAAGGRARALLRGLLRRRPGRMAGGGGRGEGEA